MLGQDGSDLSLTRMLLLMMNKLKVRLSPLVKLTEMHQWFILLSLPKKKKTAGAFLYSFIHLLIACASRSEKFISFGDRDLLLVYAVIWDAIHQIIVLLFDPACSCGWWCSIGQAYKSDLPVCVIGGTLDILSFMLLFDVMDPEKSSRRTQDGLLYCCCLFVSSSLMWIVIHCML